MSHNREASPEQQHKNAEIQETVFQAKDFLHAAVEVMERPYKLESMRKILVQCASPYICLGLLKLISIVISFST